MHRDSLERLPRIQSAPTCAVPLLSIPFLLQLASAVLILTVVGAQAWDDGAITLAFSRTFAESGRIALTPVSEQVEGFSSLAWFALNAAASLFRPTFDTAVMISQLLSAACVSVSLVFLLKLCRQLQISPLVTLLILGIAGLCGPALAETANGMEMTLLSASSLALVYYLYFEPRNGWAVVAAVLFITSRFEAIFFFGWMLVPLLLERNWKRAFLWAALGAAVFGSCELLRIGVFDAFLPNTIYAKMHPPYSQKGLEALQSRLLAALELPKNLFPFILVTLGAWLVSKARGRAPTVRSDSRRTLYILAAPIVAAEIFSLVTGLNAGYRGRMQFFAHPFALLLLGMAYDSLRLTLSAPLRALAAAVIVLTIPLSWYSTTHYVAQALRQAILNTAPMSLEITPDTYRETGQQVETLRRLLGMETISFMTPDIGGVGLCCEHIRVVDIALLANRELARRGYGSFERVFSAEKPDVIEVHSLWSTLSGIYDNAQFRSEYVPVYVGRDRLFLRRDHSARLVALQDAGWCSMKDPRCAEQILKHRYAPLAKPWDDEQFQKYDAFLKVRDVALASTAANQTD